MREGRFCGILFRTARKSLNLSGEMSEWLKEHAWKACVGETLPWVRIPLSPPIHAHVFPNVFAEIIGNTFLSATARQRRGFAGILKDLAAIFEWHFVTGRSPYMTDRSRRRWG